MKHKKIVIAGGTGFIGQAMARYFGKDNHVILLSRSKKFGLPAYTWLLELGAALIGTESEMVLKSRWAYPAKLLQSGFLFKYNELEHALTDIVSNTQGKKQRL